MFLDILFNVVKQVKNASTPVTPGRRPHLPHHHINTECIQHKGSRQRAQGVCSLLGWGEEDLCDLAAVSWAACWANAGSGVTRACSFPSKGVHQIGPEQGNKKMTKLLCSKSQCGNPKNPLKDLKG